ncbi:MAG: hypothetical protein AAGD35_03085 [Actinomycetota bacterium]
MLIVMPGLKRNADQYRDAWAETAAERGLLLVVPELPAERFPQPAYNLGGLLDADGRPSPVERRTFALIDALFAHLGGRSAERDGFHLYGHSAGAQFVHRYLLFSRTDDVLGAVSANAGWYTLPDPDLAYPFGLADAPVHNDPKDIVELPLTVLLGAEDRNPAANHLAATDGALAQGPHRFARGQAFMAAGRRLADRLEVPLRWRLGVVDGIGHSNKGMVAAAAVALFDDPVP